MIMPIALATDGFIDRKENVTFLATDNFLSALNKVFTFIDKDLQEFDGNSCKLAVENDPKNSIFIYTNDLGVYLYQIQTATPYIHKNKMLWECTCFKIENINILNNITSSTAVNWNINFLKKRFDYYVPYKNALTALPTPIVKPNFKPVTKDILNLNYYGNMTSRRKIYTLKIKCMVNPTTENLTTLATDGSYNFYFYISQIVYNKTLGTAHISNAMKYGENILTIAQVVSKYAENIKSIELYPFFYRSDTGCNLESITGDEQTVKISSFGSGGKWTDCGLFFDNDIDETEPEYTDSTAGNHIPANNEFILNKNLFNPRLDLGGGSRGFIQTPLGNIPLNFETDYLQRKNSPQNGIYIITKNEGWILNGVFKVEIPPLYINLYTDNAGQVFIQNMTTNAQELRQINRDYVNTAQNAQGQAIATTFGQAISGITNLLNLSFLGSISSFASNKIQYEQTKAQNKNNYDLALANYNDKIKTQSLLAKFTGREISGNVTLSDFFQSVGFFNFMIFIERNYISNIVSINSVNNVGVIPQKDYDYNCDADLNSLHTPMIVFSADNFNAMFSYVLDNAYDKVLDVGCQYTNVFYISKIDTNPALSGTTQIISLPIRQKHKYVPIL